MGSNDEPATDDWGSTFVLLYAVIFLIAAVVGVFGTSIDPFLATALAMAIVFARYALQGYRQSDH